jgi:ATP-dependent DNA ligase
VVSTLRRIYGPSFACSRAFGRFPRSCRDGGHRVWYEFENMAFQRRKPAAIGVKARFPGFFEPALAASIERVPKGERWIHEIKFDGYRIQLHIANEDVKVFTRRGNDWTRRLRKIAHDAFLISASSAIIDGEVVHHRLFGAAERAQGEVRQDRDGRVRLAIPQRP